MSMAVPNPVAFRPASVTLWSTIIYLLLLIPLIIVHETVPPVPSSPTLYSGINLTEAWCDLTSIAREYHPYNSVSNVRVRQWLLARLGEIVKRNGMTHSRVAIFDDRVSNVTVTSLAKDSSTGTATYFEGDNVMVYIRGEDDPPGDWWDGGYHADKAIGKGGVLVNAHFDSVSTGRGATDDGMGCITILQLVKYFTSPGHQPKRGIVALLNNNEEDSLWGSRAFGNHPLMHFCHTFLNLEGAGAGGRANLFRTSDAQVTEAYKGTPHPFGTIISSDAFGLGVIRSQTDYVIFNGVYGMRGMDLAFYRPRARYHTNQDDVPHASRESLWHMLETSLHTVSSLSADTGDTFVGERPDGDRSKVPNGRPSDGLWFDIFGKIFVLLDLRSIFALSLVLLIVGPLALIVMTFVLVRRDKYYFLAACKIPRGGSALEPVTLGGRKGMFRYPLALMVSGGLVLMSAYLLHKLNPLIVYSHEYTVWAMMLSLFYLAFWSFMSCADGARPSALHRGFAILWLYALVWLLLVINTVFQDRFRVAAGYAAVLFHTVTFLATYITLCEQLALPTQSAYARTSHDEHDAREHTNAAPHSDESTGQDGADDDDNGEVGPREEATEGTPLLASNTRESSSRPTFSTTYRRLTHALLDKARSSDQGKQQPFGDEQQWSTYLPSWLWFVQFLLLGPFLITIGGQAALELMAAVHQTGADGSDLLLPYLLGALFSVVLLLPLTPFIHRVTYHVPVALLILFVATLAFNLLAFPFSAENRYKLYFQQTVDLDTGRSTVQYVGVEEYVRQAVSELPSAMGKEVSCRRESLRPRLSSCSFDGSDVPPNVIHGGVGDVPADDYASWVVFTPTRLEGNKALFVIDGLETRVCGIRFNKPISSFQVKGGGHRDTRFGHMPDGGLTSIMLYRRDWLTPWIVGVEWTNKTGAPASDLDGEVWCNWDDVNAKGSIPAYDECLEYCPTWVAVAKLTSGLLRGSKAFRV